MQRLQGGEVRRLPEALDELCVAKDEAWAKTRKRCIACDLLIVDDWLLEPIGQHQTMEVLEIVEARHRKGPLILCSQFAPSGWRAKLGDSAMADTVVDRIVFNSHVPRIGAGGRGGHAHRLAVDEATESGAVIT